MKILQAVTKRMLLNSATSVQYPRKSIQHELGCNPVKILAECFSVKVQLWQKQPSCHCLLNTL